MAERGTGRSRTVADPDPPPGVGPGASPPAADEPTLPTNASPELVAQQEPKPARMEIERSDERSWWCPYDDHANLWTLETCGGCGATRDGETVHKRE